MTAMTARPIEILSRPLLTWCFGCTLTTAAVELEVVTGSEALLILTLESCVGWSDMPFDELLSRAVAVPGWTLLPAAVPVPELTRP